MKQNLYAYFLMAVLFFLLQQTGWGQRVPPQRPWISRLPVIKKAEATKQKDGSRTLDEDCTSEDILLTRQSEIDSFPINHPNCTVIRQLVVDGTDASPAITRLDSLKYITEITGFFQVSRTMVNDLSAFSGLIRSGFLWLNNNGYMSNITLPNATYVGSVLLDSMPAFTSFAGFTQQLTNTRLGYLWLFNGTGITDFTGLESLDSIDNIGVFSIPNLQTLQGLQNVTACNDIALWSNGQLSDVSALDKITALPYGSLEVSYNGLLTSLSPFKNIELIGGVLNISGSNFTTLSELNPALLIQNVANSTDTLRLEWNWQLSACSFAPLCNYLNAGNPAYIDNNATGCNSIAEIEASCSNPITTICTSPKTLKTWTAAVDDNWNNAANWSPASVPDVCDSVDVPSDITRPMLTSNTEIGALTMEFGSELYFNGFGLTVNGEINTSFAYLHSGTYLHIYRSQNVSIYSSSLYVDDLTIRNYSGPLDIEYNGIRPFSTSKANVSISDSVGRLGYAYTSENYIDGKLQFTVNTADQYTYTEIGYGDEVTGDVDIEANSPNNFSVGDYYGKLQVDGNLQVNSPVSNSPYLGGILFGGSGDVHLTKLGSPEPLHIDNFEINKSGNVILDQEVRITEKAKFSAGLVKSASDKLMVFENGAGFELFGSNSYVWGPVQKIGNQSFVFPIGDADTWGHCTISAPLASDDVYTAQYFHSNPAANSLDTSLHDPSIQRISGTEYWKITRGQSSGSGIVAKANAVAPNVKVILTYANNRSEKPQSLYDLRVARWDGSQWQNEGNGGVNGDLTLADVTSQNGVGGFGYFTLGYTPTPIPVITIGMLDTLACKGQPFKIPFTLDTAAFSNNYFTVQLSDTAGSFANPYSVNAAASNHSDTITSIIPNFLITGSTYKVRIVGTSPKDTSINVGSIRIRAIPQNFAITGPSTLCANTTYKFYPTQPNTNVTYLWKLTHGNATLTHTTEDTVYVTPTASGSIDLDLAETNSCGIYETGIIGISVLPPAPTDTATINNTGRWLYASALPSGAKGYRWYKNDTLIGGASSNSYYASAAGNYTVRYYNDCGNSPSSNTIVFAAASLPQIINFPTITNKNFADSAFVINATSSSGLPVQFTVISGPGTVPGNVFHITGTGTVTIRATQLGDNVYDTAAPVEQTFVINKAAQVITFPAVSDRDYTTNSFNLSATSNSGLPVSYEAISGPAIMNGNTVTVTGVGLVSIRTTQLGDTNYLAALPVDRSFCIKVPALNIVSGPTSICPGISTSYGVNNIPGATYTWRIAGGSTLSSTASTATVTWPAPGTYTLIVSAAGTCGAPTANDSLIVTAITSVQPDSVHNMLPANGAVNQQLPLNLSWIPANPALYYTYDIYVWKASDAQPSTPFASNVTTVNYTIPLNSNLDYNTTYKWMVVAHNGSCTTIHTGPVQQFSLIPLPDLQVYNVNAPTSVFSGQTLTVTWKVKNNGPGNTQLNQHWTDAVFIAKDSAMDFTNPANQLRFPVVPLLVATKANVTALNAGEFYSDTATFTIPIDYNGPLYTHVVTNYQPPYSNPVLETTLVNDTAHALPPTTVILSPQPDLQIDTVSNPNNAFSGSAINITYKVSNHGAAEANGSWVDKIYISKDPLFNINNATLLKFPTSFGTYYPTTDAILNRGGILQPDSSYTVSVPVVIPNFIYGSYYIYVFTNSTASIYEGANQSNDVNHGNVMQVFLTATPKLVPVNVSVPSAISNTQTVTIGWKIQNQGAYDNIEKNKGHFYVPNGQCLIPCSGSSSGSGAVVVCNPTPAINYKDSVGFGSSYWIDRVYISTDSTGLNLANATLLSEVPHGTQNSGWYVEDKILDSKCGAPGSNVNTGNSIAPGSVHPGTFSYTVPENLAPGTYYFYVYSNATQAVYEYPGSPQITRSNAVTVSWPDLTVPSVTVPSAGSSGQPITVSYSLLNNGPGAVYNHSRKDYIYLSDNSTFDGTAIQVDVATYNSASVPVNVQQSLQKQIKLPNGISGLKYIFVRTNADGSFSESNVTNNINATGAPITINLSPSPDLTVSSISVANTVYTSTGFPFKYTVTNPGAGIAQGTWKDSIFISCNPVFDAATSYFVGERTEQNYVPSSGNYSDSFNLVLPLTFQINNTGCLSNDVAQVYFFVKTNANNGFYESTTNNNLLASGQVMVINSLVDQVVTNATAGDSAFVGRPFKVVWTVQNIGLNPADNTYSVWYDGFYISPDSVLNGNASLMGVKTEYLRLNHNQSYTDSTSLQIPNVPAGEYYLLVKTNNYNTIAAERNLDNNVYAIKNGANQPIKIYVTNPPAADLTNTILSAPTSVAVGQPVKIVYKITNSGVGATYQTSWTDDIWLSNSFQAGGVFLNRKVHNGVLLPGESYTDSVTVNIPINQPQANYTIVIFTNQDRTTYESNYTNNQAYQYISVYVPPAVDLVVNNITVPDTVVLGYATNLQWRLLNSSPNFANGVETDGMYLSSDSLVNSANDILIGTKTNALTILPLNDTLMKAQPVVSGVKEGNYYVKVKTDILNNIIESNKQNNTGVLNKKVYVTIKILPFEVVTPDVLTADYLYYKLVVPAALKGKTIAVNLISPDSLVANNQLYLALGYLPSAAHYDYAFDKPNYGNQQIIIESAVDSVYYLVAKGTKPGGNSQNITLQATVLPFTILTVNSNHGGNTGNVTVQLKGTLFRDSMTVKLYNAVHGNTITASTVYFINGTTAYATFNLSGAPLGVYDVSLIKPDLSTTTLPSSFTIEQTNNGGLLTGSGPNTGQHGSGTSPGCDPGATSGLNSQLQTEIIIPPKVFVSWPFLIQVHYTNASNVDIPAQVRIMYSADGAPLALTEAGLADGKTSLYIEFKDAIGPANVIRAGSSGTITVYGKAPVNGFAHEHLHFTLQ